jgi:hypothetical protein
LLIQLAIINNVPLWWKARTPAAVWPGFFTQINALLISDV